MNKFFKVTTHHVAKAIVISLFIATAVVFIWFRNLGPGEFFYMHDQALYFSQLHIKNDNFIRDDSNLGEASGVRYIMTFWHRLLNETLLDFGFSITHTEYISFVIFIFITLVNAYLGFYRVNRTEKKKNIFTLSYLIAFYYTFNTYTLIIWHTGNYSLNFALAYSFVPLVFSIFHELIKGQVANKDLILLAIALFFITFHLPLLAVVVILLSVMTFIGLLLNKNNLSTYINNLVKLGILYIPLSAFVLVTVFYEFYNIQGAINQNLDKTYNMVTAGLKASLYQYFSWAIYTPWNNKLIFSFGDFFSNKLVLFSYYVQYAVLILLVARNGYRSTAINLGLIFFALSIFFVKGAAEPFGGVYLYLFDNIPFFKVLRTPDSKMAMGVILSLSLLMLLLFDKYKKRYVYIFVVLIACIQSYPLLSGQAITGFSKELQLDRRISIPAEYNELSDFFEKETNENKTVLIIPPIVFSRFSALELDHLGKDIIPSIADINTVYIDSTSGIYRDVFETIENSIRKENLEAVKNLGINYVLLRKDVYNPNIKLFDPILFKNIATLAFKSQNFEVYKFTENTPLIKSDEGLLNYKKLSPVQYSIEMNNYTKEVQLEFLNSPHSGWRLYKGGSNKISNGFEFLQKKEIGEKISGTKMISNKWVIDPKELGNIKTLTLYFLPQAYTNVSLVFSVFLLTMYIGFYVFAASYNNKIIKVKK